jgi:outer membrane biosynthesis protein TonB
MDVSADLFEDGLERLLQTRDRVNYDDPRSEKAIAERIQQMTHSQIRLTGELEQGTPQQSFIAIRLHNAVRAYVPEGVEPPLPGEGQGDMLQRPEEPVGPPEETGPKNEPTEEPTPEPTDEPTPEPTEEPTEESSGVKPGNSSSGNGSGGKP